MGATARISLSSPASGGGKRRKREERGKKCRGEKKGPAGCGRAQFPTSHRSLFVVARTVVFVVGILALVRLTGRAVRSDRRRLGVTMRWRRLVARPLVAVFAARTTPPAGT